MLHLQRLQRHGRLPLIRAARETYAEALAAAADGMPSRDLRVRDWMPAEPVERYLDAVEQLAGAAEG